MTDEARYREVYVLKHEAGFHKIGISGNPQERANSIDGQTPLDVSLFTTILSNDAYLLEQALHTEFTEKHHQKEWFELDEEDLSRLEEVNFIGTKRIEAFANQEVESLLESENRASRE